MLLGRYSAVPQAEAAIFIKGLFQGCSQMFTFMADDWAEDPSQGIDEVSPQTCCEHVLAVGMLTYPCNFIAMLLSAGCSVLIHVLHFAHKE